MMALFRGFSGTQRRRETEAQRWMDFSRGGAEARRISAQKDKKR